MHKYRKVTKDDVDKVVDLYYNKYTRAQYRSALLPFIGVRMSAKEFQDVVLAWGKLSKSTIYQRRAAISALLDLANDEAEPKMLERLKFPNGKPRQQRDAINEESVEAILNTAETVSESMLLTVLLHTGLRIGSVRELRWGQLIGESFKVKTKRDKVIEVFTTEKLRGIANAAMIATGKSESDYVFGSSRVAGPLSTRSLSRMFNSVVSRAGYSDLTPHSMRHTFATRLVNSGAPVTTIAQLMGHENTSTTSLYLHQGRTEMQEYVQRASRGVQ